MVSCRREAVAVDLVLSVEAVAFLDMVLLQKNNYRKHLVGYAKFHAEPVTGQLNIFLRNVRR